MRITVQLIDVSEDKHLWADSYDRRLDDVFAVQSEIAQKVARTLKVRLLGDEKKRIEKAATKNRAAHLMYLKGRSYWNERTEEGLKKAIGYFEKAIEEDDRFALAYAGLADSYGLMVNYNYIGPSDGLPRAKVYAKKALEYDENLTEAHVSLAVVLWNSWDFRGAGKELKIALDLNPSYARAHQLYGDYLHYVEKDGDGAIAEKRRSKDLDPFSPTANLNFGGIFSQLREYDVAIEAFKQALVLFPDYWNLHVWLGMTLAMKGLYEEGITELMEASTLSNHAANVLSSLGGVYALAGRTERAKKVVQELNNLKGKQYISPLEFAYVYTCLGDKDQAFEYLQKAFDSRVSLPESLLGDPVYFDKLGGDPRFRLLLEGLGLGNPIAYMRNKGSQSHSATSN